jgi:hypothetical protein
MYALCITALVALAVLGLFPASRAQHNYFISPPPFDGDNQSANDAVYPVGSGVKLYWTTNYSLWTVTIEQGSPDSRFAGFNLFSDAQDDQGYFVYTWIVNITGFLPLSESNCERCMFRAQAKVF